MWDPEQKCGILNDYDLAKLAQEMQLTPAARHLVGTPPFLAVDILSGWDKEHLFQFELESFLSVTMWITVRYQHGEEIFRSTLEEWLSKDPRIIYFSKMQLIRRTESRERIPWHQSETFPTMHETWIKPLTAEFLVLFNQQDEERNPPRRREMASAEISKDDFYQLVVEIFNEVDCGN